MTARPTRTSNEHDETHDPDRMPEAKKANNEITPASGDDVDKARRLADDVEHPDDDIAT
ncbi:MAG: hypothetical protein ACE37B_06265 [Ilumatobacter sp.]|jgi:hypothetical protein|uniref:hypothetical protein n=1 Tax=Ilumatobacter sp. TaxID=1967498 RepID=UPI0039198BDD